MLEREELARAAQAALDLVEDQDGSMPIGEDARRLHELRREWHDAGFAEDRLEEDRGRILVDG